ncbi:MAG: hypothetical protein KF805_13255 [Phycisphaeraceae bacterium]|nr:hypothetical protein [Phycisphaeraceae bacterium]
MRWMFALAILFFSVVPNNASAQLRANATPGAVLVGRVQSGSLPIGNSLVTLYVAGSQKGTGAQAIAQARADSNGFFALRFAEPENRGIVYYAVAEGPIPTIRLATVLGTPPLVKAITINERTTVATACAMAQFIDGSSIGGKGPGLQNASLTVRNLVNLHNGDVGRVLGTKPNGSYTTTMAMFNSLANAIAGGVRGLNTAVLFAVATPPGGPVPTNTLDAAINIAHNSWRHPVALFALSQATEPYTPALESAPITWALALKYTGNGHEFDGPGAIAFDAQGNAWINNNYGFRNNHSRKTCGSKVLSRLTPSGEDYPGAPYNGFSAGVDGAGFGMAVDPFGRAWVGNFGFFGSTCPCQFAPLGNSVSLFTATGIPVSPSTGYTQGCIAGPQSTVSDHGGSIWMANSCGGSVTRYAGGNPNDNWIFDVTSNQLVDDCLGITDVKPFGIALDHASNAWVSLNGQDSAVLLSPTGVQLARAASDSQIKAPLGIAIDSVGDVYVSNSAIIHVPCYECGDNDESIFGPLLPDLDHASVSKLSSTGATLARFTGGGIFIPWGIAVDGDDNVWVANFGGNRVSAFQSDGTPIAPFGFHSDAILRVTGVSIDPSGNVWLANNWLTVPVQTNPGGDGVVVVIGIAAPVKTPLLGPPQQP